VCVSNLSYPTCDAHAPYYILSSVVCLAGPYFPPYLIIFYQVIPLRVKLTFAVIPLRVKLTFTVIPLRVKLTFAVIPLRVKLTFAVIPLRVKVCCYSVRVQCAVPNL